MALSKRIQFLLRAELNRLVREAEAIRVLLGTETDRHMPIRSTGFRGAIRAVIEAAKAPLSSRQITAELEAANYVCGGKGTLGSRVSGELWKMNKRNILTRTADKKYSLPEEEEPTDAPIPG